MDAMATSPQNTVPKNKPGYNKFKIKHILFTETTLLHNINKITTTHFGSFIVAVAVAVPVG